MSASRKKPIWEQLNSRQREAVRKAHKGEYTLIIKCIMECQTALNKLAKVRGKISETWKRNSRIHYNNLQGYLLSQITDLEVQNRVCDARDLVGEY